MNPTQAKPQCAYGWHPVGDSHQKLEELGSSPQVRVADCSLHGYVNRDTGVCALSSHKAWAHTPETEDGLTFIRAFINTFLLSLNKHLLGGTDKGNLRGAGRIGGPQNTQPGDRVSAGTGATQCHSQKDPNTRLEASSHHLRAVPIGQAM